MNNSRQFRPNTPYSKSSTSRVIPKPTYKPERLSDSYGTRLSNSKYGPRKSTTVVSSTSRGSDFVQYKPLSVLGQSGEKPNMLAFPPLPAMSFADACSFKPADLLSNPGNLQKASARSFVSIMAKKSGEIAGGVKIKPTSPASSPSVMPKDLFKSLPKSMRKSLVESDYTSDSDSEMRLEPAKPTPNNATPAFDAQTPAPHPEESGEVLMEVSGGNTTPVISGSNIKTGYNANSFAEAFSKESWIYYAGMMKDHVAKMETIIRAKGENCSQTLLVKMCDGFTPGGSPEIFQMSISGSISLRKWLDTTTNKSVNLQPNRDFIVTPSAVAGVAEIFVRKEEHRQWLISQNRFSYNKLLIGRDGEVINKGTKGFFYITSLRTPPQLFDILGAEFEHSSAFDKPLVDQFKLLCPEASVQVLNIEKPVPCYDPDTNNWTVKNVQGFKRVTLYVPPTVDFVLPDGPMVLNLEEIGERIVHTKRVLAATECIYCGGRCSNNKCSYRCKFCGLKMDEDHYSKACPNSQHGDIGNSNLWVESSAKTALRLFTNPLKYNEPNNIPEVLKLRKEGSDIDAQVEEVQARLLIIAGLPAESRQQMSDELSNKNNLLTPTESTALRTKARVATSPVEKRQQQRQKREKELAEKLKRQETEALDLANKELEAAKSGKPDTEPSIHEVDTQVAPVITEPPPESPKPEDSKKEDDDESTTVPPQTENTIIPVEEREPKPVDTNKDESATTSPPTESTIVPVEEDPKAIDLRTNSVASSEDDSSSWGSEMDEGDERDDDDPSKKRKHLSDSDSQIRAPSRKKHLKDKDRPFGMKKNEWNSLSKQEKLRVVEEEKKRCVEYDTT